MLALQLLNINLWYTSALACNLIKKIKSRPLHYIQWRGPDDDNIAVGRTIVDRRGRDRTVVARLVSCYPFRVVRGLRTLRKTVGLTVVGRVSLGVAYS